jgi:PAS domain S-box-containing protein
MKKLTPEIRKLFHDHRNTLAVIKLYAQLGYQDQDIPESAREFFNTISGQTAEAVLSVEGLRKMMEEDLFPGDQEANPSLRESDKQLEVLLSNLPGMAYRCKNAPGWPMEFISEGCLDLTGYDPEDFIMGKKLQYEDIIHPDDRNYVNDTIQEYVVKDMPFTLEYRIKAKDGTERRVWEKGRQVLENDNMERRLEGFIMDISERIHVEEELKRNQEMIMSVFRVSPSGIGMVINRVITEINDRICEMTGYSQDELIGQNALMLYPSKEDYDYVGTEKYRQIEKTGIGVVETRWKRKNGTVIDILLASTPLVNHDNSQGVIFTALDITNFKKTEEEKRRIEEQLFQARKLEVIGKLAGGVAHEFNNTLQVINTLTELSIMKLDQDHPVAGHLDQIRTSVRQSSAFIGQLLTFARKQPFNPVIINLNDYIGSILVMLHRLIGDRIKVNWIPGIDLWQTKIDPVQLNQVLINLTINARDAIGDDGTIDVITGNERITAAASKKLQGSRPGEFVRLTIRDNGCGMEKEILQQIFDPFFTTKPVGKGTGLGLSTVYGIVNQNHGFILADSQPGKGSTFHAYFPRSNS